MLPQFGISEFLLIAIVALIVVGPKDLPLMMRKLGRWVGKLRAMANEFRSAFDDLARQAELDELRKEIEDLKRDNIMKQAVDDLKAAEADINSAVMRSTPRPETEGGEGVPEAEEAAAEVSPDPEPEPAEADPKPAGQAGT